MTFRDKQVQYWGLSRSRCCQWPMDARYWQMEARSTNLKASQRQMQGCADQTCSVSDSSSLLSEDPVIEIESDPIFHAEQHPTGDRR